MKYKLYFYKNYILSVVDQQNILQLFVTWLHAQKTNMTAFGDCRYKTQFVSLMPDKVVNHRGVHRKI